MSCTEAGRYPFAEDLGPQLQATPDGANPLEQGLSALSLLCPPRAALQGLFDGLFRAAYLQGLGAWSWPGIRGEPSAGLEPLKAETKLEVPIQFTTVSQLIDRELRTSR